MLRMRRKNLNWTELAEQSTLYHMVWALVISVLGEEVDVFFLRFVKHKRCLSFPELPRRSHVVGRWAPPPGPRGITTPLVLVVVAGEWCGGGGGGRGVVG